MILKRKSSLPDFLWIEVVHMFTGDVGVLKKNQLSLKDISFWVRIGTEEKERAKPQEVFISVSLSFLQTPKSVATDSLTSESDSGVCYEEVVRSLDLMTTSQSFHLVEHLAYKCYESLRKKWNSPDIQIQIAVKKFPSYLPELKVVAIYLFGDPF